VPCRDEAEIFCRKLDLPFMPPECAKTMANLRPVKRTICPGWSNGRIMKGSLHTTRPGAMATTGLKKSPNTWTTSAWPTGPSPPDHSKSSFQANGLDQNAFANQIKEIKPINERLAGRGSDFRLLAGTEVDIFA